MRLVPSKGKVEKHIVICVYSISILYIVVSIIYNYSKFFTSTLYSIFNILYMIAISVNEKEILLKPNTNILELLQHLNSPLKGIAVAINQNIIQQSNWETQQLENQDQVLIIQATQGG